MSATLYALVIDERRSLDEMLEEAGGELTPEIEALLTALELRIEDKLERVGVYYKQQVADSERCKQLAEHYAARAKAFRTGADGLKAYAERLMRMAGIEQLKRPLASLAIQTNPPSVQGELDEFQLRTLAAIEPAMVRHTPEHFALVKAEVLKAHKAGQIIPSGLTVEQSTSLRIR